MVSDITGDRFSNGATKIIDRVPKKGKEQQLESAIQDITNAMRKASGINSAHIVIPTAPHQPAYKMAITTYIALFPTILLVHAALAYIPDFCAPPPIFGNGIAVAIVFALMTYVIMLRFTRLMAFRLYPRRHSNNGL